MSWWWFQDSSVDYRLGSNLGAIAGHVWRRQRLSSQARAPRSPVEKVYRYRALVILAMLVGAFVLAEQSDLEFFATWPVAFAYAGLVTLLLRGPLSWLPDFPYRLVRFALSLLFFLAFGELLSWRPLWSLLAPFGMTQAKTAFLLLMIAIPISLVGMIWGLFSRVPLPRR